MIDLHIHILPGADDGAHDLEEAAKMARIAADSGVKCLTMTPHCNIPELYDNYLSRELVSKFAEFKRIIKEMGIPIQLLCGMEVFATPELPELLSKKKILTLNGTRYFLAEFAFDEDPGFCENILETCSGMGYVPVIAHPERYYAVQDYPEIAAGWFQKGYAIQINKGSVLGRFGQSVQYAADELLRRGMVTCVASDAHSAWQRTPDMKEIREFLTDEYGKNYAGMLLSENPRRILTGKETVRLKRAINK